MLEKKQDGIYIDTETNQVVFEYDELDEASQRSLDMLSKSIRDNPPEPWVEPRHKNEAVEKMLGKLRWQIKQHEYSQGLAYGMEELCLVGDQAGIDIAERLIYTLSKEKRFDNIEEDDLIAFVKDWYIERKNEADLALRTELNEYMDIYHTGQLDHCENFIDSVLGGIA
jgi:hypothetical protein